jgi:hypothetical protein
MTTPFGAARQDERPLLCHHLPLPRAPSDLLQLEGSGQGGSGVAHDTTRP